jgi:ankyrin repeat protein
MKQNAVHTAVLSGQKEMLSILLNNGLYLIKDSRGISPVHMAVLTENLQILRYIIEECKDKNKDDPDQVNA